MEFFGHDDELARLEASPPSSTPEAEVERRTTLAWYLRERENARALELARAAFDGVDEAAGIDGDDLKRLRARATLVYAIGRLLRNDLDGAFGLCMRAREAFEALGDAVGSGDACLLKAVVSDSRTNLPRRDELLDAAESHYRGAGDPARVRLALFMRVRYLAITGDADQAARLLEHALAEAAPPGPREADLFVEAMARAQVETARGDTGAAVLHFQLAYELGVQVGAPMFATIAANNACAGCISLNDFSQALEWAQASIDLARSQRLGRQLATAIGLRAEVLRRIGRAKEALKLARRARAILAVAPARSRSWGMACHSQGMAALDLRCWDEALACFAETEAIARHLQAFDLLIQGLSGQAEALTGLGRMTEAVAAAQAALQASESRGAHPGARAEALHVHARLAHHVALPIPAPDGGEERQASAPNARIHYLEAALAEMDSLPDHPRSSDWLAELSLEYERLGDLARALELERRAAAARTATQAKRAQDLATSMRVRHETERIKAGLAHQKALALAESRRADAANAANRAKSTFLANMSHELRSPLNAMLGFSRLLLRNPQLHTAHEELGIVLRSGEHLYGLITQLLEMSRLEAGRAALSETEFDLHALLDEVISRFAGDAIARRIGLELELDPGVPQDLRADAMKLQQVLVNLVGNAVRFTRQGAVRLHVSVVASNPVLRFAISDTGMGMTDDELAQVGQAFVQAAAGRRSTSGAGLGLAICRSYLTLMGSELRLDSAPGVGTTAQFDLAVQVLEARAGAAIATLPHVVGLAPGTPPMRVLAVDDMHEGRLLLARLLTAVGFEVRTAADGEDAIAEWRQWSPRLVLMDVRMPGIGGLEATRSIKATPEGQATVVIALTASTFDEQRDDVLAAGCDDLLRKPFREDALFEIIGRHLGLQYVIEAPTTGAAAAGPDAARLATLAPELRRRLEAALARLDVDAIDGTIEEIGQFDESLAQSLSELARRFEYGRLLEQLRDREADPQRNAPAQ